MPPLEEDDEELELLLEEELELELELLEDELLLDEELLKLQFAPVAPPLRLT